MNQNEKQALSRAKMLKKIASDPVGDLVSAAADLIMPVTGDQIASAVGLETKAELNANIDAEIKRLETDADVGLIFVFGYVRLTRYFSIADDGSLKAIDQTVVNTPHVGSGVESKIEGLTDKGRAFVEKLEARTITRLSNADGLIVNSGVAVIIGGANTAKSPLLLAIAKQSKMSVVLFGEPVGGGTTNSAASAASRIVDALTSDDNIGVAIDSIKNLVSRSQGPSMSKGTSRDLLPMLSDWSNLAIQLGKSIVTVVNIGTDNADAVREYEEAVLTNVTTRYSANGGAQFNVTTRMGYALKRLEQRVGVQWLADGSPSMNVLSSGNIPDAKPDAILSAVNFDRVPKRRVDFYSENLLGPVDVTSTQKAMDENGDSRFARVLSRDVNNKSI